MPSKSTRSRYLEWVWIEVVRGGSKWSKYGADDNYPFFLFFFLSDDYRCLQDLRARMRAEPLGGVKSDVNGDNERQ